MFQNMRPGRTKFSRGSSPWGRTTRLPEAATPEGPLAAVNSLPTMEAFTDLSYLKTFYQAGAQSISKGNIQGVHWTFLSQMRRPMIVATRAARRETPTKIPVPHVPTPTRRCKKRRDEITDSEKDETGSKLNEIVGVMKDSAHDLVARSRSPCGTSLFIRRGSAFSSGCLNSQAECHDITAVISRSKPPPWHSLTPHQTLPWASMQARPRISQGASTSSSQADHAQSQQYPMHPPPQQDQRLPLVLDSWSGCIPSLMKWWATFLHGHFYKVIYIWPFLFCLQSVS